MELLYPYWREALVAGLSLFGCWLFLITGPLRPAIMIFTATAVSIALNIDEPTPEAAMAVVNDIRDTILHQAHVLF